MLNCKLRCAVNIIIIYAVRPGRVGLSGMVEYNTMLVQLEVFQTYDFSPVDKFSLGAFYYSQSCLLCQETVAGRRRFDTCECERQTCSIHDDETQRPSSLQQDTYSVGQ